MDVDTILRGMNDSCVDCLLIGGMNFLLRHEPVLTFDVDLWIEDCHENRVRTEQALVSLRADWGASDTDWRPVATRAQGWLNTQAVFCLTSPAGAIDIFREVAGLEAWRRKQWLSVAVIGTLLLLGGNGLVSWAEQTIPSGIAALIIGAVPMFLVVIESFRPGGVKPTLRVIVGLLIGFTGIYILVGPSEFAGNMHLDPLGVVALLAACLLWALGSVYSKSADLPKSALMMTGSEMLIGSVSLFLVSFLTGEFRGFSLAEVSRSSWIGLAYLITFGSMIGFVSYAWLLQNAPISLVATYAYVNPLVAVLLGNLFLQEPLSLRVLFASVIIIGSVVFINSARQPKVRREARASALQNGD